MKTQEFTLSDRIEAAIAEAHTAAETYGPMSPEAATAWDIVEELEAEASHQRVKNEGKTAFSEYCKDFPDALEARLYDN